MYVYYCLSVIANYSAPSEQYAQKRFQPNPSNRTILWPKKNRAEWPIGIRHRSPFQITGPATQ